MTGHQTPARTRVELFARSSLPSVAAQRRDTVTRRLEQLADVGHVSTVSVHTWQKKVPVEGDALENVLYETFSEWATDVGIGLEPFFDTRECFSRQTGERGTKLVLPAISLAVYRDDDLQSVYPHSTPTGARTVMDCLNALESGKSEPDDESDTDPETEESLVEAAD
jgi:hypothetical protein